MRIYIYYMDLRDHFLGKHSGYLGLTTTVYIVLGKKKFILSPRHGEHYTKNSSLHIMLHYIY